MLAARYATEVNTLGANVDELRERRAALDRACAEIDRDPAMLRFSVMTACFLGETQADVLDRVGRFLAVAGNDAAPEAFVAERRARWLVGTVEEVAERIEGLRAVGVDRVLLQHLNADDDDMVALAGGRLAEALR